MDLVVAAYIAGREVPLSEDERNAAVRRALFVFAAGGELHREPTLDDPAVHELARDLDTPERRTALLAASEQLNALEDPDVDSVVVLFKGGRLPAWHDLAPATRGVLSGRVILAAAFFRLTPTRRVLATKSRRIR